MTSGNLIKQNRRLEDELASKKLKRSSYSTGGKTYLACNIIG